MGGSLQSMLLAWLNAWIGADVALAFMLVAGGIIAVAVSDRLGVTDPDAGLYVAVFANLIVTAGVVALLLF